MIDLNYNKPIDSIGKIDMLEDHFEKLIYFSAVAEHGGFAAAARRLRLSQSSLSTAVKIVEETLGTQLFDRTRKGAALTPAGERLLAGYKVLRSHLRDIESELKNLSGDQDLVVGTHDAVATGLWPGIVQDVATLPWLNVSLGTNPSAGRLMQLLRERMFDCIIVAEPQVSDDWDTLELGFVSYGLYVAPDREGTISKEELVETGVIVHGKALAGRGIILDERLHAAGLPVNTRLKVDSLEAVREMITEGLGPGVLPVQLSKRHEQRGLIKRLKTKGFDQADLGGFQLGLCVPRGRAGEKSFRTLLRLIKKHF